MKLSILIIVLIVALGAVSTRRLRKRVLKRRKSREIDANQFSIFETTMKNNEFTLGAEIAAGGFGVVHEATKNSKPFAAKAFFYRGKEESEVWKHDKAESINEVNQLKEVNILPFVMPLCESFPITEHSKEIGKIFVMPKGSNKSFLNIADKLYLGEEDETNPKMLREDYLLPFLLVAAKAVEGVHKKKIIHGDIKLQNFVIYETQINSTKVITPLLIDFGTASTEAGEMDPKYVTESALMTAPDIQDGKYMKSLKNDIYSLGMVFGMLGFDWMFELYMNQAESAYSFLINPCVPMNKDCFKVLKKFSHLELDKLNKTTKFDEILEELLKFITNKMICEPEQRASIEEVKQKIQELINKAENVEELKTKHKLMKEASKKAKADCS